MLGAKALQLLWARSSIRRTGRIEPDSEKSPSFADFSRAIYCAWLRFETQRIANLTLRVVENPGNMFSGRSVTQGASP
jgi:hypothetical protein